MTLCSLINTVCFWRMCTCVHAYKERSQQCILISLSQGISSSVVCSAFPYSCLSFGMCKLNNTLFFAVFPVDKVSPYSLCQQRCPFIRYTCGLITPFLLITGYLVQTGPAATTFSLSQYGTTVLPTEHNEPSPKSKK